MTDAQLKYNLLAKRSKALCLELEKLLEDVDVLEKLHQIHAVEQMRYRIDDIRYELDTIWDQQVDGYFLIIGQHRGTIDK